VSAEYHGGWIVVGRFHGTARTRLQNGYETGASKRLDRDGGRNWLVDVKCAILARGSEIRYGLAVAFCGLRWRTPPAVGLVGRDSTVAVAWSIG